MPNINVRIDDKTEIELKKEAKELKMSVSDLVRARVTGNVKPLEINKTAIEERLEKVEYFLGELIQEQEFMSQVIYQFICLAKNKQAADEAIQKAREESK